MKKQKWIRKGMAFVLSLAMVAGLVPAMSGGANKVQAATGSGTEPSVSAYATKTQLMDEMIHLPRMQKELQQIMERVVPCRNFPSVRMVQSGSRVKDSLRMEVMFRQRGILFSLTGKMTEALTM